MKRFWLWVWHAVLDRHGTVSLSSSFHDNPDEGSYRLDSVVCRDCGALLNQIMTFEGQPWR